MKGGNSKNDFVYYFTNAPKTHKSVNINKVSFKTKYHQISSILDNVNFTYKMKLLLKLANAASVSH